MESTHVNEPAWPPATTVPLRIDSLVVRGVPLAGQWQWPRGQHELALSVALDALSETTEDWGDASHCRLHCDAGVNDTLWWLHTNSAVERCVINGQTLAAGQGQRLHNGDEVEVGLLRFMVHTEAGPDNALSHGLPAHDQAQAQALFDLSTLEAEDSSGLISAMQRETRQQRSITDLVGDVSINWAAPMGLQPSPSTADQRHATTPNASEAPPLAQRWDTLHAATTAVDAALSQADAETPVTQPSAPPDDLRDLVGDSDDPLQLLHGRYIAHLRNPYAQNDPLGLSLTQRTASGSSDDPLSFWMQATRDNQGLSDVVDATQSIDDLIAQLDAPSDFNILAPERVDDVLQLFAPEALQVEIQQRDQLGLGLPALTRVEHHSVSLDSPMPIPGSPRRNPPEST